MQGYSVPADPPDPLIDIERLSQQIQYAADRTGWLLPAGRAPTLAAFAAPTLGHFAQVSAQLQFEADPQDFLVVRDATADASR